MPRMSKKRRLEWSFFLRQVKVGNTTCDRITYNDLCRGCTNSCKQDVYKRQEPVNGQDERRKCAAVDSPARLCCSVIKRATAQNAAALCHYSERGISMTEHEKYQEHIRHTHDAFCKTVIRHAAIDAARSIRSRRKREISLEYLIEEKHYPFSTTDKPSSSSQKRIYTWKKVQC